ncbi:MAG: hypothetical protein ACHQ15_07880, partial [Candidatus Limnocylindrales bacterium]
MDVATRPQVQLAFHVLGARPEPEADALDGLELRPALLAPYRDLGRLRYDFPLVLVDAGAEAAAACGEIRSLTGIVDELLRTIAPPGPEGEGLRGRGLRLEREIRALVTGGAGGRLSDVWARAATIFSAEDSDSPGAVLAAAGAHPSVDGLLLDCDETAARRVVEHAWAAAQAGKAERFHARAGALMAQLADILRAAAVNSAAGRTPDSLRASVGGPHQEIFDFAAMSRLLPTIAPDEELPAARRRRLEAALAVLQAQPFFAPPPRSAASVPAESLGYRFDDCASALVAFRKRLPRMAELVRALAIAELEADGRYDEARHDAVFATFDAASLGPADLATFPDLLVCIPPGRARAAENSGLLEALASGLPIKILVETDTVLEPSPIADGQLGSSVHGAQLASTALGLDDVFVLQTTASDLYQAREGIRAGIEHPSAALLSVFSAPSGGASPLPPYLLAAAALQGRAFPAFCRDPRAGADLDGRFSLADDPQPALDWPVDDLAYADARLQRVQEPVAFTLADYAAADGRYARYFAVAAEWDDSLIPAAEWLDLTPTEQARRVPYVLAVDGEDVLRRLVVDARLMRAVQRARVTW